MTPTQDGATAGRLPRLLTVPEVGRYLRISRSTAYQLVQNGSIRHSRIGRRVVVTEEAVVEFIRRREDGGEAGEAE